MITRSTEQKRWIEIGRMPVKRAGTGWTVTQETGEMVIITYLIYPNYISEQLSDNNWRDR